MEKRLLLLRISEVGKCQFLMGVVKRYLVWKELSGSRSQKNYRSCAGVTSSDCLANQDQTFPGR